MTITVSTQDPRSIGALDVLATSNRWTMGHRNDDGRSFFAIPGSSGRVYRTDTKACTGRLTPAAA